MGLCRKECLERNERAIVQMHVEENLLLAQVCYDIFDKRGKNRLLYSILYEADVLEAIRKKGIEAFFAWYICDPAKGIWKYNVMPPEDASKFCELFKN
ncbi:unnamed protein product [Onchocerca ochengi]|uniref:DUF1398 domain-containing protein n=1 Tax=Onchocerca ochengi TaxID=42157 RepID=A0A182EN12_ONCOC|nr:unnamed protein product [Onchocerca ochengi]